MHDGGRKVKPKLTVMRFIIMWFVFLWVTFSVTLLGVFGMLSQQLEIYLIRKTIRENMRYYERHLFVDGDGNVSMDEEDPLDAGYYVILQGSDGTHILGKEPEALRDYVFEDVAEEYIIEDGIRYIVSCRKYDTRKHVGEKKDYILCGIADPNSAPTMLDELKLAVIGFLIFSFLMLIAVYWILKRRVDLPLKRMSEDALEIGADRDFSSGNHYESGFYEIDTLEQAYLQLYEKMAEVIRNQETFNSNVSHELRTPLTVIGAQCEVSREAARKDGDDKLVEALSVIDEQAEKMREMINILLRLSRLKIGNAKLELEEFDLVSVVEAVCDEESVTDSGRKIICDLEETMICADVNLIMIAVRNLLSNAIKYSFPNGEIRVRCAVKDGRAFCSVSDQGIGITEDSMGRIFDNFYRGEESRSSEGIGLGLSLAKQIMEIQGGEITVESCAGEGSTFTLWF